MSEEINSLDTQQFSALRQLLQRERYVKALDLCNKILTRSNNDSDAIQAKIFCLMHMGKYDQCLEIAAANDKFCAERAYCLYKKNKYGEALDICNAAPKPKTVGLLSVEAQSLFKLHRYADSMKCYQNILDDESFDHADRKNSELLCNYYASSIAAGFAQEALNGCPVPLEAESSQVSGSYQVQYNIACALISVCDFDRARDTLNCAWTLCQASDAPPDGDREGGGDGDGDGPYATEVVRRHGAYMTLQSVYVNILAGMSPQSYQSSLDQCRSLLKVFQQLKSDHRSGSGGRVRSDTEADWDMEELAVIATNNLAVLRGNRDLPETLKRFRAAITNSTESKLSSGQLMDVRYNQCVLLLCLKKTDECVKMLNDVLDKTYGITTRGVLLRASVFISNKKFDMSDSLLRSVIAHTTAGAGSGSASINGGYQLHKPSLMLFYAQTLIARSRYQEAREVLQSIPDLQHTPAGVSALYALDNLIPGAVAPPSPSKGHAAESPVSSQSPQWPGGACPSAVEMLTDTVKEIAESSYSSAVTESLALQTLYKIADILQSLGEHEHAAKALQAILVKAPPSKNILDQLLLSAKLSLSLSYCNIDEAERFTSSLPQIPLRASQVDGSLLEAREIPRVARPVPTPLLSVAGDSTDAQAQAGGRSMSDTKDSTTTTTAPKNLKQLMKRARRREAYLKALQESGKFDPLRPVKPDPERWLPRNQRSYTKRSRKNRNKFVGGQGSGDGAQKDMVRLDAHARAQAEREKEVAKAAEPLVSPSVLKGRGKKKR